jgi:hypothetical protein
MRFSRATASHPPPIRLSDYFDVGENASCARKRGRFWARCDILTASLTHDSCKLFQNFTKFLRAGLEHFLPGQAGDPFMTRGIGALFLGAAVMSIFVPAPRGVEARPVRLGRTRPAGAERPADAAPVARMLALVQTRPFMQVLAISESREELEREMQELNETWNDWRLRSERQRYEIQPAPVLRRVTEPNLRKRVASA